MNYFEEELDMTNSRIIEIEKNLALLQVQVEMLHEQIKETQKFLLKLAFNQKEVTKKVTQWPYVAVYREEE